MMTLIEAIHSALDGRAILFTGAGFSYGATQLDGDAIPSGASLASALLTEIGYANPSGPLDKAAAAYLRRKERTDLVDLLIKSFTVANVSESHRIIATVPWKRIYTTNYDRVFEEASRSIGRPCTSVEGADTPRDHLFKPNPLIVHINGAVDRLTLDRLDSTFKLVSQSYAADSFEDSGWAFHFRNDIRSSTAVIFVGYSMYDLDVRRVLFSEDISEKCIFVIKPISPEDELDAEDLSDLGSIFPIGLDAFAHQVKSIMSVYVPTAPEILLEGWMEVRTPPDVFASPKDAEVLDFLIKGELTASLLVELSGPKMAEYFVDLGVVEPLLACLLDSRACALLTGDLGAGKTTAIECVSQRLIAKGWRVFWLDDPHKEEVSEAEEVCDLPGEKLMVIENYQHHMPLLKWLSEVNPGNASVVLTARTSSHDLRADELYKLIGDKLRIYELTQLSNAALEGVRNLFDHYGLWGDRLGWGVERKRSYLRKDCSEHLASVLVDILKSKHISERYTNLLKVLPNRCDVEKVAICAFALEVIGFAPRISYVEELLANSVSWPRLRVQVELKSIIDFERSIVRLRSSVLAAHLLHNIFSAKKIVETLVGMTKEAERRRHESEYKTILYGLLRYGNVSAILPEKDRLGATVNYYEGVKNLSSTKKNPQFWLQYGIACLTLNELGRSERYFKDAYSLAGLDYDTRQVDNHYARLLLEKAIQVAPSASECLLLVDQAKKIILRQMREELRYYPYRVALGIFRCYERFEDHWSGEKELYFQGMFKEIKERSESTKGSLKSNRYVKECLMKAIAALGKGT